MKNRAAGLIGAHIDAQGHQIELSFSPLSLPLVLRCEERQAIERHWADLTLARPGLYDGELVHVASLEPLGCRIVMRTARGLSYKDVVGLRAIPPHLRGPMAPSALGTMVCLISSDNHLLLRFRESGDWEKGFELAGGFVRAGEPLLASAQKRITEDFRLKAAEICGIKPLAIYTLPGILESVVLFHAQTTLTAAQALARVEGLSVENKRTSVFSLIKTRADLHPPSISAMRLYLRTNC